jgi:hypothetical protein
MVVGALQLVQVLVRLVRPGGAQVKVLVAGLPFREVVVQGGPHGGQHQGV